MRSEIIFQAQKIVGNKYELCSRLARLTRRTHFLAASTQYAIIDAFVTVANNDPPRACMLAQNTPPYQSQRL
jgi:hypothetical protein